MGLNLIERYMESHCPVRLVDHVSSAGLQYRRWKQKAITDPLLRHYEHDVSAVPPVVEVVMLSLIHI